MTNKNIFEFNDYKAYLNAKQKSQSPIIRGFRSRLAEAAGCNNAFVSQVLNTHANFSLEQALSISRYLEHKSAEQRYFLLMLELARAGTPELREYFNEQMSAIREHELNIENRVKHEKVLSVESQAIYYSQWYYAAIHMLVTISDYRTVVKIAKYLKLGVPQVQKVVSFLISQNLLVENEGELAPGPSYLHLERSSPFIARHHSNWRLVSMESLARDSADNIHYSTVSTLSQKDIEILRAKFVQVVHDYVQTVTHSKEEAMWVFNLDFFKLGGE